MVIGEEKKKKKNNEMFYMLENCYKEKRNSQFAMFIANRTTNARFRVVTSKSPKRKR